MRSHSVLLAIVVAALCLSLVTADWTAKLKAQPVKHAKAHAHHHKHHATKPPPQLNLRPIIGIFTDANSDNLNETGSKIPADYVKWLEQGESAFRQPPMHREETELSRLG
jgi:hypothetical protein